MLRWLTLTALGPRQHAVMNSTHHPMSELFAQLGLPNDEAAIRDFIDRNRPLPMTTRIFDAPFWSPSQSALIRDKLTEDGDWSVLIDTLNTLLRDHPDSDAMAHGDSPEVAMQGEGNFAAARRYDKAAQAFVASGQVETAARDAAPHSAEEVKELRLAEADGRAKART